MVVECEMLKPEEWWQFDRELVDRVAFPVGDRYPEEIITRYFSIYGGLVRKFRPKRVLEIGVRYGYTAIVMAAAAKSANPWVEPYEYIGVDDESYHGGSCTRANDNFRIVGLHEQCRALKWNSITHGIPPGLGTFDLIHVDGNHETYGVLNDLSHTWPILNVGGFIILDDWYFPEIKLAIDQWLEPYTEVAEVLAVQFIHDERGHALIYKSGLKQSDDDGLREFLKQFGDAS